MSRRVWISIEKRGTGTVAATLREAPNPACARSAGPFFRAARKLPGTACGGGVDGRGRRAGPPARLLRERPQAPGRPRRPSRRRRRGTTWTWLSGRRVGPGDVPGPGPPLTRGLLRLGDIRGRLARIPPPRGLHCAIGSIQNVAEAMANPHYVVPFTVLATLALPILVALFFGTRRSARRFARWGRCKSWSRSGRSARRGGWTTCWGSCPTGYVLWARPSSLRHGGGRRRPGTVIVCPSHPFVGMFRMSPRRPPCSPTRTGLAGPGLLRRPGRTAGSFAPTGAILKLCSRVSKRHVRIPPRRVYQVQALRRRLPLWGDPGTDGRAIARGAAQRTPPSGDPAGGLSAPGGRLGGLGLQPGRSAFAAPSPGGLAEDWCIGPLRAKPRGRTATRHPPLAFPPPTGTRSRRGPIPSTSRGNSTPRPGPCTPCSRGPGRGWAAGSGWWWASS